MESLQDLKATLLGRVESAYLVVRDSRAAGSPAAPPSSPAAITTALAGGAAAAAGAGAEDRYFHVQYNPQELQIYSSAAILKKLDITGSEQTNTDNPASGHMELSVTLFFDKMDPAKAFSLEKPILPTVSSALKAAGTAAGLTKDQAAGGVQAEVEGFIAALRNSKTRRLTFYWADFSFGGILMSVGAEYTMFAGDGTPVRAKVTLRVRQNAGDPEGAEWKKNFTTAFADDQSSLVRPEQRFSSMLNPKL
ncbi:MAG: hypothetical protein LBS10_10060 [Gracilibacteraceae bacterium]|jgi:hypothetical protein|nr:hypothetical protein [Gracilibacteraceae bacterium]